MLVVQKEGSVSNIPGMAEGVKLKPSEHVEADVEQCLEDKGPLLVLLDTQLPQY